MPNQRPLLDAYPYRIAITTRWMDNDIYGHINNVAYYSFFDTAANRFLIERGGLDIAHSPVIGLVVESKCAYHAPLAYPSTLRAGVRVDHLGNRAVTYGLAVFDERDERAAASGHFVHVFVDRVTRAPVPIPEGSALRSRRSRDLLPVDQGLIRLNQRLIKIEALEARGAAV